MTRRFIIDFKENEHIENVFYVFEKSMGIGKTGKHYLSLKISDKTGILDAKIWDKVDYFNNLFERDDFIYIKGTVQLYQGAFQLVINDLRKATEKEIILEHFIPDSGLDIEKLWKDFINIMSTLKDPYLKKLYSSIFIEDMEIQQKFKNYPAAKSLHHAYRGGLLEHSLNVVKLANFICEFYKDKINRDILLLSAALHDIGKIYEMSFSYVTTYTTEGKLLGHIILADELILKKANDIKSFPQKLLFIIRHNLISHHGEYEFGSPKRPKTLEALIIHFLDNLDAKVHGFYSAIEKDIQSGEWTSLVKAFDRQLFKGSLYEIADENHEIYEKSQNTEQPKTFNPVLKNINFELFKDKG